MNKKILLLTASYGSGHITATKSLQEMFKKLYPDTETKVVDFLDINNTSSKEKKLTFFQKLYNFSMEKPIIFDIFFYITNNKFCSFLLSKMITFRYYKTVEKLFDEYKPDLIISSHPYWNFLVKKYKKKKNVPYICIITDSYMIHNAWIEKSVDYYCVIDDDSKHVLINKGMRNIVVTGFPVSYKLFESIDRNKILSELGLKENKLTILITIGLGALEKFLKIIEFLRTKKEDFQLIIITGKYQKIYEELKNKNFIPPTVIIGWTDRMYDFICASDLVICKGGGAITSEALSARCPIFIPLFVPGQERGNVYIIKKYKMGFYEEKLENVFCNLEEIISKNINLQEYVNNIKSYVKYNPAEKIVKFAYKLIYNL